VIVMVCLRVVGVERDFVFREWKVNWTFVFSDIRFFSLMDLVRERILRRCLVRKIIVYSRL
jgi:hypothetical protein